MAQVTLFTSPMARKKPVDAKYNPNSYRVISCDAEQSVPSREFTIKSVPHINVVGQVPEPGIKWHHRKNRPNENHVGFLSQDVKLLNEPICDVYTNATQAEQGAWWPHRNSNEPHKVPQHTLDTISRGDYQYRGSEVSRSSRHHANPHKKPAWGSVPVNFLRDKDGKQRFWKEGISYEHQYNCRLDPQYPVRSKRHGSFVWDKFSPSEVDRMLHHYGIVADRSLQTAEIASHLNASSDVSRKSITKSKKSPAETPLHSAGGSIKGKSVENSSSACKAGMTPAETKITDSIVNTKQGAAENGKEGSVVLPPI